jgi:hypothetical protein
MNRRSFLAASGLAASGAVLGQSFVLPADMLAALSVPVSAAPVNLLASTFVPLASSLLSGNAWHPFPKASDRAAWAALPQDVRDTLVAHADKANSGDWPMLLATDELEFKRTGNRTHYEGISFGRRGRLGDLVLGDCVAGTGKYLDQIANGVWLICEETFWGAQAHLGAQKAGVGLADAAEPIIELFSAETAATLAWVTYLLGDRLAAVSPLLTQRIALETKRRVLDPYFERNDFWWMGLDTKDQRHQNNWNPWINSNVLTAVLLLEPDGPRRAQMVNKVCRSVDRFLSEYSPDGACEEGPGYWARSAASFYDCCHTLVSAHGGKGREVLTHPFTRAMGHFILDVHIAKNAYVNYGDAHVDAAPEPELLYNFGRATGDEALAEFGAFEAARRPLTFGSGTGVASLSRELAKVFTVAAIRVAPKHDALMREAWYPALGLMTAREKEGLAEGFYVALQAASNGRPHGHNDSGSFIVFFNGEPVFIDVGVGTYTAQTFSKDRYKLWPMQSAFHNLPTIGGVMQHEGDAFRASGLKYATSDARTGVAANLATAYPKDAGVERWMRTLTLDRAARKVELVEDFALTREAPVTLSFMCAKEPVVSAAEVTVGGVVLTFDAAVMKATAERIALTDAGLEHSWGQAVWRVLLSSVGPVKAGTWKLEMRGV